MFNRYNYVLYPIVISPALCVCVSVLVGYVLVRLMIALSEIPSSSSEYGRHDRKHT